MLKFEKGQERRDTGVRSTVLAMDLRAARGRCRSAFSKQLFIVACSRMVRGTCTAVWKPLINFSVGISCFWIYFEGSRDGVLDSKHITTDAFYRRPILGF